MAGVPPEFANNFMPDAAKGVIGAGVGLITLAALVKNIKNLLPVAKNPEMHYSLRERHERALKAHGPHAGELISRPIKKPGYIHAAWGILVPVYVGDRVTPFSTDPFEHEKTGKKMIAHAQFVWAVNTEGAGNLDPRWNPIYKAHYKAKGEEGGLKELVQGVCMNGLQLAVQTLDRPEVKTPDRDEWIAKKTKEQTKEPLDEYGVILRAISRLTITRSDANVLGESMPNAAGSHIVRVPEQERSEGHPDFRIVEGGA